MLIGIMIGLVVLAIVVCLVWTLLKKFSELSNWMDEGKPISEKLLSGVGTSDRIEMLSEEYAKKYDDKFKKVAKQAYSEGLLCMLLEIKEHLDSYDL